MLKRSSGSPPWSTSPEALPAAVGLAIIGGVLIVAGMGMDRIPLDALSAFITLLVLIAATVPVLTWMARQEGDPDLFRILFWGMVATVIGMGVRYFFVIVVYNDSSDAGIYSEGAILLLADFKKGVFSTIPPNMENFPPESQRRAGGHRHLHAHRRLEVGGLVVFAWMAFAGRLMLWRALKRAVPEANTSAT
ncbi:MAG: hypothetical protein IPI82_17635 [Candidatus Microthrix sp.]|nr:hypothetical protein [Candidatus Microthrix sp.]MBK7324196.1 hypothetical protein [Candidatus Microthrix sp.]